jgi:hypothetical protein
MSTTALGLFVLLPLFAFSSGETPHFAPEKGSALRKSIREELALELDSLVKKVDGREFPGEDPSMVFSGVRELTLTDEYLALADGQVERLRRRFGELRGELGVEIEAQAGGMVPGDLSGRSELEDTAVLFERDGDECTASFESEEGKRTPEEALLAGLREDVDLLCCLPADEVEEGDTWDIDPAEFANVLAPGGALDFDYSGANENDASFGLLFAHLFVSDVAENVSGSVKATWLSTREEDGRKLGRIGLEIDVECNADQLERARAGAEELGIDKEQSGDLARLELATRWKGTGEVDWDMAAGRVHGCTLEGALDCEVTLENRVIGDHEMVFEAVFTFTGSSKLTLVTEEP